MQETGTTPQPSIQPASEVAKTGAGERVGVLAEELAGLRDRLGKAELELSTLRVMLAVPQDLDNKQIKARCNLLATTAEHTRMSGQVCPFCGKGKGGAESLANHLYRRHREQVSSMPAHRFE